jgi:hypothetical protein
MRPYKDSVHSKLTKYKLTGSAKKNGSQIFFLWELYPVDLAMEGHRTLSGIAIKVRKAYFDSRGALYSFRRNISKV